MNEDFTTRQNKTDGALSPAIVDLLLEWEEYRHPGTRISRDSWVPAPSSLVEHGTPPPSMILLAL